MWLLLPVSRGFPGDLGDTIPTELQKQRDQVAPSDVLPLDVDVPADSK